MRYIVYVLVMIISMNVVMAMSNPAADYCVEQGYEYQTEGSVCIVDDEKINAWDFYNNRETNITINKTDIKYTSNIEPKPRLMARSFRESAYITLPEEFSWKDYEGQDWMTPVKDQGNCGSCWAFATTAVIEAKVNINLDNSNYNIDLSEQDLVSCSDAGTCCCGTETSAFDYIQNNGILKESCFNYEAYDVSCSNRCNDWNEYLIGADYNQADDIKQAIVNNGPVTAYMVVCGNFDGEGIYSHEGNVFTDESCWDIQGQIWYLKKHVVVLLGYNDIDGYWIGKNSWGTNWGDNGYFKISYSENVYDFQKWWDSGISYNNEPSTLFLDESYYATTTDTDNDLYNDDEDCEPLDKNINPGKEELCNNKDDNCNDIIDEDMIEIIECGYGICEGGEQQITCSLGEWINMTECSSLYLAGEEICNGLDDNCNNILDGSENLTRDCGLKEQGACTFGKETCDNQGNWVNCTAIFPEEEICQNGIDEDCDGIDPPCCLAEITEPLEKNYCERRIPFNLTLTETFDSLKYIDLTDPRPRNISLCTNCNEYGSVRKKVRSFQDGYHDFIFYSTKQYMGCEDNILFFIDSKKPRISRIEPRNYCNGTFKVRYNEDNINNIYLYYGDDIISKDDCPSTDRYNRYHECVFEVPIAKYEGQKIEYNFAIEDPCRTEEYNRPYECIVDTIPAYITDIESPKDGETYGRYVYFNITLDDNATISYIDNNDIRKRERRLCSNCDGYGYDRLRRRTFREGTYDLTIITEDKAGNQDKQDVIFEVSY